MAANTATIQYNTETGDLYLETYLIDALGPNARGWGVSPDTIKARVQASVNHPLTLYKSQLGIFDHPVSELGADDHATNRKLEQKYSIGFATKIREVASNLYHAIYKITNADAKRYLLSLSKKGIDRLGLFTSPGIIRPASEDANRTSIRDFIITHNAIVSIPANTPSKAAIKDVCHTATQDCTHLTASMMTPAVDDKCEYCMAQAFETYLSSINATDSSFTNSIMSNNIPDTTSKPDGVIEQPHQQPTAAESKAPVPAAVAAAGGYIPKEDKPNSDQPNKPVVEDEDWKAKYEALKLEKEQSNKTLEDRINEIERRRELDNRGRSVLDIFYNFGVKDILPSREDFDKKLEYYVNSKYSEDEIADLVQAMIVKHQVESGQLVQNTASSSDTLAMATPCSQRQESASHSLVTEKASSSNSSQDASPQIELIKDIFANAELEASKYQSSLRQSPRKGGLIK